MQKVLTAAQMREVDRLTTERYGIPSILLMENAAHAVARVITERLSDSVEGKSILILCGPGNNGGDGAALARMLVLAGADVELALLAGRTDTKGDARTNFDIAHELLGVFHELRDAEAWTSWFEASSRSWDVTVDAVFGTGLNRPASGIFKQVIDDMVGDNASARYQDQRLAVSIDMPSGLIADDANASGAVLEADLTVTFTAPKSANVLPNSYSLGGELVIAEIGSPWQLVDEQQSQLFVSEERDTFLWLGRSDFTLDSYKNKRGHALLIAGSKNYTGAAVLAGDAAIRSGCGLVTLAVPESSWESVVARVQPEVMVRGIAETQDGSAAERAADEVNEFLKNVDAVSVGSGLSSKEDETIAFVRRVVEKRQTPVVIDADGLTALSPWATSGTDEVPLILTPHEGEFRKMLALEKEQFEEVIKDRVQAVRDFATKHNVYLVLKGERNLIGSPDGRVVVNPTGNSGLGKAGNGDTLTGIITGFVAQAVQMNIDMLETLVAAVYVAGMAGDIAEKKYGKRVMTASDVRECLVEVFSELGGRG